jgi:hypothetical protein
MVDHICNLSYSGDQRQKFKVSLIQGTISETLSQKQKYKLDADGSHL